MSSQFTRLPNLLLEQLSKGRVVPFIGSGLSINAGLPDWRQLLEGLAELKIGRALNAQAANIQQAISAGQYELAADALSLVLGDQLGRAINDLLDSSLAKPTVVHRLLGSVRWPAVITTNYDALLSQAFAPTLEHATWADDAKMEQLLHSAAPHIMFAHGTLQRTETIVLTPEHYRQCLRHPAYRTYLKVIFTHYTVLFLGFGFSDRDVNWLLEDLRADFGFSEFPHFALVAESQDLALRIPYLRRNFNVEIIPYSPSAISHPEVEEFVRRIVDHSSGGGLGTSAIEGLGALERQRDQLSAAEYMQAYAATCKGLSQIGYVRTAWVSLQSELRRAGECFPLPDRLKLNLDLAELMMTDGEFESAHRVLQSFSQLPLMTEVDVQLVQQFAKTWFVAAYECYYGDTPGQAFNLALSAGCAESDLAEMRVQIALLQFLHGDEAPANGVNSAVR
jgi:hypothetical protein